MTDIIEIMARALFAFAHDEIPDAREAAQAVLIALQKRGFVVVRKTPESGTALMRLGCPHDQSVDRDGAIRVAGVVHVESAAAEHHQVDFRLASENPIEVTRQG